MYKRLQEPQGYLLQRQSAEHFPAEFAYFLNWHEETSAMKHLMIQRQETTVCRQHVIGEDMVSLENEAIERAAQGDRESQRHIYETLFGRVHRTVYRLVGATDADDVTQDVFLHLFASLYKFRFEADFVTWAHRLVVNSALQHLRRRRRNSALPLEAIQRHPEVRQVDPDLKELFEVAFSRLDAELRMILDLKEAQGLSYSQIAEIAGIPEGTVGSQLNRARRELKCALLALGWEV